MYKVGISSWSSAANGGFELDEASFIKLKEAKIDAIEIAKPADEYKYINYKEVETLARKYDIDLWSYHLPLQFDPLPEINPASLDKEIRQNTIHYLSELVRKGADIGIDKFVIHASGEPVRVDREEKRKYALEVLDTLAELAHQNGAIICVEDLPRSCLGNTAEDMLSLLAANDKLKVCFDTNHLLKDDNINFMDKLADKIVTLHVSDYDFINERHWLPGEGKIDWIGFMKKFNSIGYKGVWMYEVSLKCPKSIIRDRNLNFNDFYDNAMSLFAGKQPESIGRPIENLGMWP